MRALLLAFFLCGTAAAQIPPPVVKVIQPNILVAEGNRRPHGFLVAVEGTPLPICRIDLCGGTLTIGGQAISPINAFLHGSGFGAYFANDFPPGPADVELRLPTMTLRIPNAVTFVADADYETVLLPHTAGYPLPGANGSLWRVEQLLRNDSPYSIQIAAPMFGYTLVSPPPPDVFVVPPQTTVKVNVHTENGPLRVRLPKVVLKDTVIETRFYDEARLGANFGTRIPTVREHELRRGSTTIPDVPMNSAFRTTLRVFSPDGISRDYRVHVLTHALLETAPWSMPPLQPVPPSLLATYTIRTEETDDPVKQGGVWSVPMASFPIPAFAEHARVQVRIEPIDAPDAPFWAYVSVTNNETQQVTLLTP